VTHFFTHLIVPNVFWLRRRVFHPFCPYCYQISGVTLKPPLENQRASSLFDPRRIFIYSLREIIAIERNFPLDRRSKYLMKTSFGGLFFEFYGDFIS
jgi:hypothetical protein